MRMTIVTALTVTAIAAGAVTATAAQAAPSQLRSLGATHIVTSTVSTPSAISGANYPATATCADTEQAVGGGVSIQTGFPPGVFAVIQSQPSIDGKSWVGSAATAQKIPSGRSLTVTTYAVCAPFGV
ncbi:hypothetical protein [Streptacidiphilus albus]|uniref:hypothetical protein n=1 Tax=Streptacidiphilus albus TaxID=105425 RepID=UPI00054BA751|nr:hypothetical protein [Streptacidiphilus albus]